MSICVDFKDVKGFEFWQSSLSMQVPTIFLCLCWWVQRGCRSWPWAPIKIGMGFMTLLYEWGLVWSNIEDLHSCGLWCSWFCIFYVVWFIHIFSLGVKLWIQLVLHDTYNMELTTCWFPKVLKMVNGLLML